MDNEDLEYLFRKNPYKKNIYPKNIPYDLPDIHLDYLKKSNIKYKFNPAKARYLRSIDILRMDESIITTINPPRYGTNALVSYELVKNKIRTESYIRKFNINTPDSKIYDKENMNIAKNEAFQESDEPVVIKPLSGTLGSGVMVNVFKERFEYNWNKVCSSLRGGRKVLVQKYIEGFEARATIIEGRLTSITARIPPFVVGNGENTIEELIELKNKDRESCGVLSKYPMKNYEQFDEFLKSDNLSLCSVPDHHQYILLGSVSNIRNGGETINITDLVGEEIKEVALDTIAIFPGLFTGGLDVMMKSFDDTNPMILEVNSFPVIGIAAYPTYGKQTKPSKNYIESVISVDQYIYKPKYTYNINDEKVYIESYLRFMHRKNKVLDNNFNRIYQLYK